MAFGKTIWTWFAGRWHPANLPLLGAADHATWLGSLVFDGARSFEGVAPDLDLHCQRLIRSARAMGLTPPMTAEEVQEVIEDGIRLFPADAALYLRPMMWATEGSVGMIDALPGSTEVAICIEDLPMAPPGPFALTLSPFRRPRPDMAVTEAKAACHYAHNARILREARARGFDNGLSLDSDGHVAETASTNVFMVRDGVAFTPRANGTFLAGITRARVIGLLRDAGIPVEEASLTPDDFAAADEIFLTGNARKVQPVTRFEDRILPEGPVGRRARALYWDYAHARMPAGAPA